MPGLYHEIWTQAVKDGFYPARTFLTRSQNMSEFVNFNKIHLAELGTTPAVYINNAIGTSVSVVDAEDNDIEIPLDTYDSQNTRIYRAEQLELSYNKLLAYTAKHKNTIYKKLAQRGAWKWAPVENTATTPVLAATGAANANGFKKIKLNDVIDLASKYNDFGEDIGARILVLSPTHLAELQQEDKELFKAFVSQTANTPFMLYGFEVYMTQVTPTYDPTALEKDAFGAVSSGGIASFSFLESEVAFAEGSWMMFHREAQNDPEKRADTIGFQARFLTEKIRDIGSGAIVSVEA